MKIDNLICHTSITGMHYHRNRLFIGCGQNLEIYCLQSNQRLIKEQVFDSFNIYGINVYEVDNKEFIIIYGNRFFSVYESIEQSTKIVLILDRINLYYMILESEFRDKKIHCLLSSNKLGIFDIQSNRLNVIDCEQKCIVYTSIFLKDYQLNLKSNYNQHDANSIYVASGTVFSNILILNYTDTKCTIIDKLTGHEGVLFALDYKNELNLLVSASDDRQVRCWYFDLDKNAFECKYVLYGHESR